MAADGALALALVAPQPAPAPPPAAGGGGSSAGPAGAVALALEPAYPRQWPRSARQRDLAARARMEKCKKLEGVLPGRGAAKDKDDDRLQRHLRLMARAFPASCGMPDPADWKVEGKTGAMKYRHPHFLGKTPFSNLLLLAGRVAQEQAAGKYLPGGAGPLALPPVAALPPPPAAQPSCSDALAQTQQLLADDGPLAEYARAVARELGAAAEEEEEGGAAAPSPGRAGPAAAGAEEEREEGSHDAPSALLSALERTRGAQPGITSIVLVGITSAGKSCAIDKLCQLSEVDEGTYRTPAHKGEAPRTRLDDKEGGTRRSTPTPTRGWRSLRRCCAAGATLPAVVVVAAAAAAAAVGMGRLRPRPASWA